MSKTEELKVWPGMTKLHAEVLRRVKAAAKRGRHDPPLTALGVAIKYLERAGDVKALSAIARRCAGRMDYYPDDRDE